MGVNGVTVHGFRSTFSDWCGEETEFDSEAVEFCLSHSAGNAVRAAYCRKMALEKRRVIMDAWATFCSSVASQTAPLQGINSQFDCISQPPRVQGKHALIEERYTGVQKMAKSKKQKTPRLFRPRRHPPQRPHRQLLCRRLHLLPLRQSRKHLPKSLHRLRLCYLRRNLCRLPLRLHPPKPSAGVSTLPRSRRARSLLKPLLWLWSTKPTHGSRGVVDTPFTPMCWRSYGGQGDRGWQGRGA
jgi:hypothetical protein